MIILGWVGPLDAQGPPRRQLDLEQMEHLGQAKPVRPRILKGTKELDLHPEITHLSIRRGIKQQATPSGWPRHRDHELMIAVHRGVAARRSSRRLAFSG